MALTGVAGLQRNQNEQITKPPRLLYMLAAPATAAEKRIKEPKLDQTLNMFFPQRLSERIPKIKGCRTKAAYNVIFHNSCV